MKSKSMLADFWHPVTCLLVLFSAGASGFLKFLAFLALMILANLPAKYFQSEILFSGMLSRPLRPVTTESLQDYWAFHPPLSC